MHLDGKQTENRNEQFNKSFSLVEAKRFPPIGKLNKSQSLLSRQSALELARVDVGECS